MKKLLSLLVFTFIFGVFATTLLAQVNPKLSLQGILRDANGLPVPDGTYDMEFNIYNVETSGTSLWTEPHAGVQVTNGIYAVKLGGTTALTTLDFEEPYFVGISIDGTELAPRIELTYAPYTIKTLVEGPVICTGAIGDIKYSSLDPTTFETYNGDCWIPMDGRDITGSELENATGWTNVPDMSGQFIRAHEWNDGNDPERTPTTAIATPQGDQFKSHSHSQRRSDICWSCTDGTVINTNSGGNTMRVYGSGGISTHAAGGLETRPKNMNFYIYIRIN